LGVANLQGSLSQQLELVRKAASQIKDPAVQQRVLDAHKKVQKIYPRVLEASQAALRDPKTLSQSKAANAQLAVALAVWLPVFLPQRKLSLLMVTVILTDSQVL